VKKGAAVVSFYAGMDVLNGLLPISLCILRNISFSFSAGCGRILFFIFFFFNFLSLFHSYQATCQQSLG
jgi:hypothetical protein